MQGRLFDESLPVQDADLLARLNTYLDHLEPRLQQGQGWLIFNSSRERSARIIQLLQDRLAAYRHYYSLFQIPWRDFALHAYMSGVVLPREAATLTDESAESRRKHEHHIAQTVATATAFQLTHADLLILSNVAPHNFHETATLAQTVIERTAHRRSIIALTEHDPWSLSEAFGQADPTGETWEHFYMAMRESSLIAH